MQTEDFYRLALSLLYRTRIRTALAHLERYGTATEVWKHLDEEKMQQTLEQAEREAEFMEQHSIQSYWCQDDNYPYRLLQCPDRPLMLFAKGNVRPSGAHMLAIVGTRNATDRAKQMVREMVLEMAQRVPDLTIVSGLAYGIDVAAHRAAIEAGIPTIIVPAHGLDRIYPSLHRPVAIQALDLGGILTEYPSQTEPLPMNFVARNRIVAGLSDAVLVAESRAKGGSLITANMAVDYDREVFAVPGRPTDESFRGCNALIRSQRAALVESADDLLVAMNWDVPATATAVQTQIADFCADLSPVQRTLLEKLREQEDGMHINIVVMETGIAYNDVSAELTLMELQGLVRSLPGGLYRALK